MAQKNDNSNPNFRNPRKNSPYAQPIKSLSDYHASKALMRSGELTMQEQAELGGAMQDLIDECR
jgi:hypothetical protein